MKRRADIKTKTYEADYGFMVDIVDDKFWINNEPMWEVYLYRASMGTKEHMFGLPKDQTPTIKEVLKIVEANLPGYYSLYDEEHAQFDDVDRGYEDDYDLDDYNVGGCPYC